MNERFDERDTIFSRMFELIEGTDRYTSYYTRHPELEEADRILRSPSQGTYSGCADQAVLSGGYSLLADLRDLVIQKPTTLSFSGSQQDLNHLIRETAGEYKAAITSIGATNKKHLYSYRGRGRAYGQHVSSFLPYSIIFAVPMDKKHISQAPEPASAKEVVKCYIQAAIISLVVSYTLKEFGYSAVSHIDGESQVILHRMAEETGMGRIGHMGLLLTKQFGPRVRLSAVTTDAPLNFTDNISTDVQEFCRKCGRCSSSCPAGAIAPPSSVQPQQVDHLSCYRYWRKLGTDCGICLAVCPYGSSSASGCAD